MDSEKVPDASQPKNEEVVREEKNDDEESYPPTKIVIPAIGAICLAIFLIALDRTILGTAIPAISNEFQSFGDISWYEAGFLLPLCVFQLTFGRIYTYYSAKWALVIEVAIFEIGSIVSATAPNSAALIVGRAITGIGGAGVSSGALVIINSLVPLRSRPKYLGSLGSVFGLASIVGPLLGGYLTAVTWRWCFWINVPIGAISLVVLLLFTPNRPPALKPSPSLMGKIAQLDPLGGFLIAVSSVCLIFALQFGGIIYPWSDGRIIALFVLFGVFGIAFIAVQIWLGDNATVPPKVFTQRTMLAATIANVGGGSIVVVYSFYLPIWFQAIKGDSPQDSGLSLLGFLLSVVVFVMASGIGATVVGYYTPFMILGGAFCIIGSALISTFEVGTGIGMWIGYQVILGAGQGFILQQPNIAAQTVLPKDQVAIGLTLLTFVTFLSGSIFVTVCQTLLENKLVTGLAGQISGFDPGAIANSGATSLRNLVPADQVPLVLQVYNDSLRSIWYVGIALSVLVFIAAFGFEWKSIKGEKAKFEDGEEGETIKVDDEEEGEKVKIGDGKESETTKIENEKA